MTTTVRIPRRVYEEAKSLVEKQRAVQGPVSSLNDLMVAALKSFLKMHQRRQIDAAFAGMAVDTEYQKEAQLLADEFAQSDWETLRLEEEYLEGDSAYDSPSR